MKSSLKRRALAAGVSLALCAVAVPKPSAFAAQAKKPVATTGGAKSITADELKTWLTTLSSDEYEGRATFTEGLGLAAAYIAHELKQVGRKPGGDNGSYFQRVIVTGYKATSRSSVTVTVNGQSKTFKDGEGITFPRNSGGKQTLNSDQIEFVGYGATLSPVKYDDYAGRNVAGKVVVYLGARGPKVAEDQAAAMRRLLGGRSRYGIDVGKAVASVGPTIAFGPAGATAAPSPSPSP